MHSLGQSRLCLYEQGGNGAERQINLGTNIAKALDRDFEHPVRSMASLASPGALTGPTTGANC